MANANQPSSRSHPRPISEAWRWLTGHDLVVLLAVLLVVTSVLVFLKLADAVTEGQTQRFDETILRALRNPDDPRRPIGPWWTEEVARDITALGGVAVLTLLTLVTIGFLVIARKRHAAVLIFVATVGGAFVSSLLKDSFERQRPDVVPRLMEVHTSSFPSGHSLMSAVVYLTLGAMLDRFVEGRRLKLYCLSVALLLTMLVGCSRVFLGVHYPTDVLGGWSAGLTWAVLCWLVARYMQKRGAVEKVWYVRFHRRCPASVDGSDASTGGQGPSAGRMVGHWIVGCVRALAQCGHAGGRPAPL
jgi:undecaprenyl-diphosphatase